MIWIAAAVFYLVVAIVTGVVYDINDRVKVKRGEVERRSDSTVGCAVLWPLFFGIEAVCRISQGVSRGMDKWATNVAKLETPDEERLRKGLDDWEESMSELDREIERAAHSTPESSTSTVSTALSGVMVMPTTATGVEDTPERYFNNEQGEWLFKYKEGWHTKDSYTRLMKIDDMAARERAERQREKDSQQEAYERLCLMAARASDNMVEIGENTPVPSEIQGCPTKLRGRDISYWGQRRIKERGVLTQMALERLREESYMGNNVDWKHVEMRIDKVHKDEELTARMVKEYEEKALEADQASEVENDPIDEIM